MKNQISCFAYNFENQKDIFIVEEKLTDRLTHVSTSPLMYKCVDFIILCGFLNMGNNVAHVWHTLVYKSAGYNRYRSTYKLRRIYKHLLWDSGGSQEKKKDRIYA